MRRHIIIKTVRSSTGQLEYSFRSKLKGLQNGFFREFWNFLWFLLYHNFVSENFNSLCMEKTCLVKESHPPSREKKKTSTPTSLRACSNCLALAMRALYRYGSDLIWSVGPKCPLLFDKIIFLRTADLYPAYKHDNQTLLFGLCATGMYHSTGQVDFPKSA